ncbi:MAG: TetR family transcriptional regulator [Opitutales bacterium]|jgi:AcrR family transcriptional regulator
MARRSKDEAEETRENIIDAAITLFLRDGVSKTTLEKIATEAGYTRGAVYHHFENKATLLRELMMMIKPPAEQMFCEVSGSEVKDPLRAMRDSVEFTFAHIMDDKRRCDIHAIFLHNCEFVEKMNPIVESECHFAGIIHKLICARMEKAQKMGLMRNDIEAGDAAVALHCFGHGLISMMLRNRMKDMAWPTGNVSTALDIFFKGLRPEAADAPDAAKPEKQ